MIPDKPNFAVLRPRYAVIDREDANAVEVGPTIVLSPAKNPADLAALHELAANVEPKFAADIQALIAYINAFPNRELGTYGVQCLPHVTHGKVREFAQRRMST